MSDRNIPSNQQLMQIVNAAIVFVDAVDSDDQIAKVFAVVPGEWIELASAVINNRRVALATSGETSDEWRCFHCDEVFTDREKAAEHFGKHEMLQPACTIDVAEYRRMEEVNSRHCAEDTELHREIYRMSADHATALRREEESGLRTRAPGRRSLCEGHLRLGRRVRAVRTGAGPRRPMHDIPPHVKTSADSHRQPIDKPPQ
jgi:hypothetical protein